MKTISKILIMGTILLFPFVVYDGFYSTTQLPKLVFLSISVLCLSILSFFISWKLSKRELFSFASIFGAFIILFVYNIFFNDDVWISIVGSLERYMGFLTYSYIFLCIFLISSSGKQITFHTLSRSIIGIGIGLSIIALVQKSGLFSDTFIGSMIFEGRAMSTVGQYNTFGAFLLLPIGLTLHSWKSSPQKIGVLLSLLLLFCGIWTTGSRTALAGGVILTTFLITPEKFRKKLVIALIFLAGIASLFVGSFISESGQASIQSRKLLFSDAVSQIGQFSVPEHLLGRGFESIQPTLLKTYSPKYLAYEQIDYIPDRSHNIFLDTYIQFGFFGSILFLFIFLLYPLILFWKGKTNLEKNIGIILLIHFSVLSVGFYDIVNLFFGALIIVYIFGGSQVQTIKISRRTQIFCSLLLVSLSIAGLSLLNRDMQEQGLYSKYQNTEDDLFGIIQNNEKMYTMNVWKRDDLIAKELGKSLGTISDSGDDNSLLFEKICERNSYHILQVCVRYAFLRGDFQMLGEKLNTLESFVPYDIVMLSLKLELAKHDGRRDEEKQLAQKILSLLPAFILKEDSEISEYQIRKKEKIYAHYPINDWIGSTK